MTDGAHHSSVPWALCVLVVPSQAMGARLQAHADKAMGHVGAFITRLKEAKAAKAQQQQQQGQTPTQQQQGQGGKEGAEQQQGGSGMQRQGSVGSVSSAGGGSGKGGPWDRAAAETVMSLLESNGFAVVDNRRLSNYFWCKVRCGAVQRTGTEGACGTEFTAWRPLTDQRFSHLLSNTCRAGVVRGAVPHVPAGAGGGRYGAVGRDVRGGGAAAHPPGAHRAGAVRQQRQQVGRDAVATIAIIAMIMHTPDADKVTTYRASKRVLDDSKWVLDARGGLDTML